MLQLVLDIWNWLPELVQILLKIVVIVVPIMLSVAYLTLAERKVIGYIQVRIGPNRVGPRGLLQPIAEDMEDLSTVQNLLPVQQHF